MSKSKVYRAVVLCVGLFCMGALTLWGFQNCSRQAGPPSYVPQPGLVEDGSTGSTDSTGATDDSTNNQDGDSDENAGTTDTADTTATDDSGANDPAPATPPTKQIYIATCDIYSGDPNTNNIGRLSARLTRAITELENYARENNTQLIKSTCEDFYAPVRERADSSNIIFLAQFDFSKKMWRSYYGVTYDHTYFTALACLYTLSPEATHPRARVLMARPPCPTYPAYSGWSTRRQLLPIEERRATSARALLIRKNINLDQEYTAIVEGLKCLIHNPDECLFTPSYRATGWYESQHGAILR